MLRWASGRLSAQDRNQSSDTFFCVLTDESYFSPRLKSPSSPSSMLSHWYRQASGEGRTGFRAAENTSRVSNDIQVPALKMQMWFQSHIFQPQNETRDKKQIQPPAAKEKD